jgi:hypothetical protein
MADEAVLIIETHIPISMTCSNTAGIEKGSLLTLSDPFTVAATTARAALVGGVAGTEKINADGKTKISVYRGGVFKSKISGSVTVGDPLIMCGSAAANQLETAATNDEAVAGIALETGTNGETIMWELRPTTMQLA